MHLFSTKTQCYNTKGQNDWREMRIARDIWLLAFLSKFTGSLGSTQLYVHMLISCAHALLIALTYSQIPTTNEDSSLGECVNCRPLWMCVDLCSQETCANTHKSRLLGSVTERESTLSACEREGGHNCRFSDVLEENSLDGISLSSVFPCSSALHVKTFQCLFWLYSKQHCCTSLLPCHSVFIVHTDSLTASTVCVGRWPGWAREREATRGACFFLKKWWLDDGITTKSDNSNTLQLCIAVNENPNYLKMEKHDLHQTWFDEVNDWMSQKNRWMFSFFRGQKSEIFPKLLWLNIKFANF